MIDVWLLSGMGMSRDTGRRLERQVGRHDRAGLSGLRGQSPSRFWSASRTCSGVDVPRHDEDHPVGAVLAAVEGDEVVPRQSRRSPLSDSSNVSGRKRVARRVDGALEGARGDAVRTRLRLGDSRQRLALEPVEVGGRERGLAEHLGEEVQHEVEVARERLRP